MFQLDLFEKAHTEHYLQNGLTYGIPRVGDVTFLNGLSEPVHRWFRLTPSYSPELVRYLVEYLGCNRATLVCDPFLGKGTTVIELKKLGVSSLGVELNPLLKLASEYALTWDVDVTRFTRHFRDLEERLSATLRSCQGMTLEKTLTEFGLSLPKIHDVFRWWRKEVLKDLLLIKHTLGKVRERNYSRLYWLALCSSSIDCANVHRNHPTITFDDNHNRRIDVLGDFKENVEEIIVDLRSLPPFEQWGNVEVQLGDSTKLADVVSAPIDRVITSPPYPNRFSYVHTTRPQLFFMELIDSAAQSADLDCAAIGGTWGKATSVLYNGALAPYPHLADILAPVVNELRPRSNLMCNYAVKYFNMLDEHIRELRRVAGQGFRGAYVVGNSRLAGVEIVTDVILAKMFEKHGFKVDEILVFRKRGGRKKLYETAVCMTTL